MELSLLDERHKKNHQWLMVFFRSSIVTSNFSIFDAKCEMKLSGEASIKSDF
jgi:hypothetical protein